MPQGLYELAHGAIKVTLAIQMITVSLVDVGDGWLPEACRPCERHGEGV